MAKMTQEEFDKLTPEQLMAAFETEFREHTKQDIAQIEWHRDERTKTAERCRFRTSPFTLTVYKRGRSWRWFQYCDGWTLPQAQGKADDIVAAKVAAMVALYKLYTDKRSK